jgi:hypothetical protein
MPRKSYFTRASHDVFWIFPRVGRTPPLTATKAPQEAEYNGRPEQFEGDGDGEYNGEVREPAVNVVELVVP